MEVGLEEAVEKAVYEAVHEQIFIQGGITTLIVIVGIFMLRYFLSHLVKRKSEILDKDQRRWLSRINNGAIFLIFTSLIFIWAPQIHTFALSLTAVAVAIVLTTKELLMCITGGFFRASVKPFSIGDWITVDGITGEVMSITTLSTLIEEIETKEQTYQFTGQTVQIPNSRFLTANVCNANFVKNYIYHDVKITLQYADFDPSKLTEQLTEITEKYFSPHREESIKVNKKEEKKAAIDFTDSAPQYFLRTSDLGHNVFIVRLFIPTHQTAQISTNITKDFLQFAYNLRIKEIHTL